MSFIDPGGLKRWKGRQLVGVALLGLFLSVLAMATSATLHKVVHPNAAQADHSCAATMLASGQVETAPSVTVLPAIPLVPIFVSLFEGTSPSVASFNLPQSRGPPALLS